LGFDFLKRVGARHKVIAPDYPPIRSIDEVVDGFDAILSAEGSDRVMLGGQSYGGLLAQAYLACRPGKVDRLILSGSGPADYGRAWLPVEYLMIFLARVLPEKPVKNLLAGWLLKVISVPNAERIEWEEAVRTTLSDDLGRADVISHFAVAADMIRKRTVRRHAYDGWHGRVVVLSAENDITQGKGDQARLESLFGRSVEMVSLGATGHTAYLFNPDRYIEILEQALA